MSVLVDAPVCVSLEVGCCADVDEALLLQMGGGKYDECAVMRLPASIEEWRASHRSARKGADRAYRLGYIAHVLPRERYADDLYEINISKSHRQGRPMTGGYLHRQEFSALPTYPCPRHATRITGVWAPDGHVVAYLVVLRQGDLALVSQILGHGAHEPFDIMFLLFQQAVEREIEADADGVMIYNTWSSGLDTLRAKKARYGFAPARVEWLP